VTSPTSAPGAANAGPAQTLAAISSAISAPTIASRTFRLWSEYQRFMRVFAKKI
jgi:hypothetical protein